MAGMNSITNRTRSLTLAALLSAAVVGGCGGGGGGGDEGVRTSARDANGVSARGGQALIDAQARMARCMRRQGADFPDPKPGRGFELDAGDRRVDWRRMRAAERKCARFARAVAEAAPRPSEQEQQRARDLTLRYARCMRAHGADVPDPRVNDEGGGTAVEVPADAKSDPRFRRAAAKCEDLLRSR